MSTSPPKAPPAKDFASFVSAAGLHLPDPTRKTGNMATNMNMMAGLDKMPGTRDAALALHAGVIFTGAKGATDDAKNPNWRSEYYPPKGADLTAAATVDAKAAPVAQQQTLGKQMAKAGVDMKNMPKPGGFA